MTLDDLNKAIKNGQAEVLPQPASQAPNQPSMKPTLDNYLIVLNLLRRIKRHLTTEPTFTPQNFLDQIQFYDDEATPTPERRVYFYFNGSWSYTTLT